MSLRLRLVIVAMLPFALGFWWLSEWVGEELRPRYLEAVEESLVDSATILAAGLSTEIEEGRLELEDFAARFDAARQRRFEARIYELTKTDMDLRVYVTDRDGIVRLDSEGTAIGEDYSRWNDVLLTLRGEYGARATRSDPDDPDSLVLHVAAPLLDGDRIVGALTLAKPIDNVSQFISQARSKLLQAALAVGLVALLMTAVVSLWVSRPIRALTRHADAVRAGARLPRPRLGVPELDRLGAALESMRDALEGKRYVEGYVQTLTHEMKAPLAGLRAAVELLQEDMDEEDRQRFLGHARRETARMQNLVERLLQLAAVESRKELHDPTRVDIGALLDELQSSLDAQLSAAELELHVRIDDGLFVHGERFLLRQAIGNLLQNAIEFSPRGAAIEVHARCADNQVEIAIRDRGPGVPDYARERIFERFYSLQRPGNGPKGSGLGLTFVQEVAQLHGGSIILQPAPGGGTNALLRLPAASAG